MATRKFTGRSTAFNKINIRSKKCTGMNKRVDLDDLMAILREFVHDLRGCSHAARVEVDEHVVEHERQLRSLAAERRGEGETQTDVHRFARAAAEDFDPVAQLETFGHHFLPQCATDAEHDVTVVHEEKIASGAVAVM